MPAEYLLDEFSRFADRVLHGVENKERAALKYQFLLEKINELLIKTHKIVVARLEKVEAAAGLAEANEALGDLRADALEESFRLKGYCDVFEAYGRTLNDMAWQSEHQKDSVAGDLGAIQQFSVMLMDREREVATMYTDEIKSMVDLRSHGRSLPEIKKRVRAAKGALTDQMADFSTKAERFAQASK